MEQDYNLKKWSKGCPNTGVNCRRSSCGIEYVFIPAALGDDQEGSPVAPKNGSYNNAIVYYEATGNVYLYSSDGVPTRVEKNLDSIIAELQRELNNVEEALSEETSAREAADAAIEQEIEDLRNEPDVVDIVGTYADLLAYDTSGLGDKDIVRVLVDEMHDNESTYYRWNKTPQTWTYIGAVEGYYTRGQTDTLLDEKQDTLTAGANIQINNNVISATDTTYTAGTNIQINGTTISATDTTYSAGTGLNLNGTEFSIDNTTVATQSDLAAGLAGKQDTLTAGANVQISNNAISATDTTYSDFIGTDGTTAGAAGLVPAPATTDAGKFLKADGTWDTSSATFYTGENVSDLKVYKASRADEIYGDAFYNDGLVTQYGATHSLRGDINIPLDANRGAPHGIFLGTGAYPKYADGVSNSKVEGVISIGYDSDARSRYPQGSSTVRTWSPYHISIGHSAGKGFSGTVSSSATTFIGAGTYSTVSGSDMLRDVSVAVGFGSTTSRIDEFSIGAGSANPRTIYTTRYLANVKAGSLDTDAVNVEQLNGRVKTNAGAPTTSTVGTVGQILEDTTNGKLYICTDATNPYVWEEVGSGGGGGGVSDVQVNGTSVVNAGIANIDYASSSTAGVFKVSNGAMVGSTGYISCNPRTYADYAGLSNSYFISKGTLENVIDGKGLVDQTDLATKQDKLTAGTNITIDANNVISATGGGGASTLTIAVTYDQQEDDEFSWSGATINEIESAYNSGTEIYVGGLKVVGFATGMNAQQQKTLYLHVLTTGTETGTFFLRPNGTGKVYVYSLVQMDTFTNAMDSVDDSLSVRPQLTLSTTDIGEGASLPANTLYGVYE